MKVKLIAYTPEPEKLVAQAAKLCYSASSLEDIVQKLTPQETESFIIKLLTNEFYSPLEHAHFTFIIEGISRNTSHQIVRHRTGSYSQQSARYVNLNPVEYVMPKAFEFNEDLKNLYNKLATTTTAAYNDAISELLVQQIHTFCDEKGIEDLGLSRFKLSYPKTYLKFEKYALEDARSLLLSSMSTRLIMTIDARNLYNFFKLRCCKKAQLEIREVAWEMLKQVREVAPILFSAAGSKCMRGECGDCNVNYEVID